MSISLIETIQKNLGYPEIKKIDPNTDHAQLAGNGFTEYNLGQAAIPAILLSMCKYTQKDIGAKEVLCGDISTDWLHLLLGKKRDEAIGQIAAYAATSDEAASGKMQAIAVEAVNVIRKSDPLTLNDVKLLLANEKNNILLYLPPALHFGFLLEDNALDDNTHKMEGPVSSLVNAIGNLFSGGEREEEEEKNKRESHF